MYKRIGRVFMVLLALYGGLIMRIYMLSVSGEYMDAATRQSGYTLGVATSRGAIYDRNFTPLTGAEKEYVAAVLPSREAANTLLPMSKNSEERELLYDQLESGRPFIHKVNTRDIYSTGVDVFEVSKRYDSLRTAVHVIGYQDGDGEGVSGIELGYNDLLKSEGGSLEVRYTVDAGMRPVLGEGYTLSDKDYSAAGGVVLTIDKDIQDIAKAAADESFEKGAVVVMDIYTGEIKAMVSVPDYDPTDIPGAMQAENSPLINRALWDYSVGSSFKTLVAAAAVEQGYGDFGYECKGYIEVGDTIFYCLNRSGHGWMNMRSALEKSCNPYFVSLTLKMGGEPVLYKCEELGFGKTSELAPGIVTKPGSLPTYQDLALPGETANFGFGQGKLSATPVQIARMIAAIANGGTSVTPKLVLGTTKDGVTIDEYTPTYSPATIISPAASVKIRDYMISVVENGSGTNARPYAMGAGGKTASAQTGRFVDGEEIVHAWFAGFFPAQEPQYAIIVLAEEKESGGAFGAPVFKKICDGIVAKDKLD